jgi:hypothetical protein
LRLARLGSRPRKPEALPVASYIFQRQSRKAVAMKSCSYVQILNLVRTLYNGYQSEADSFQRAKQLLQDVRWDGPAQYLEDVQHNYRACRDSCDDFARLLSELAELTCQHLPDVWPTLRLVVVHGTRWYEDAGLDWNAAAGELRRIEAEAAKRLAIASDPPQRVDTSEDAIIWHGEYVYSTSSHDPVCVTAGEGDVMQAFIERPAMDLDTLKSESNLENARTILRGLTTKYDAMFSPYIRFPGGKGKGGYRVSVQKNSSPQ